MSVASLLDTLLGFLVLKHRLGETIILEQIKAVEMEL
jgi:hypothetical protein